MIKSEKEIQDKRNEAADAADGPPKYPGMTYAEGIRDALDWVTGDYDGELEF